MSNLRINIRLFMYHLQVSNDWKFSFTKNEYHRKRPNGWFAIYDFKPFKKKL